MFVEKSAKTSRSHERTSRKGHACVLEAPSPPSPTATATTAVNTAGATTPTTSVVLLAIFGFGRVIHEKGIELKRVWENKVADVVAADGQGVQRDRITVPHRHLDRF